MKRNQNQKGSVASSDPLDRLLRSAAQAQTISPAVEPIAWTRQEKVLAAWRASRQLPGADSWLAFFRTGVAVAGVAAIFTVVLALRLQGNIVGDSSVVTDEMAATDAAFNLVVLN